MKYPKLRNGPSAMGEAFVRALQRIRSPWLSTIGGDVIANKMGRRSEVFHGAGDGFYCLGYDSAASPTEYSIRGTDTLLVRFNPRGAWSGVSFSLPNLRPIGNGRGATVALLPDRVAQFYSSARGKKFTPLYSISYAADPYTPIVVYFTGMGRLSEDEGSRSFGSFSLGGQSVGGRLEMFSVFAYTKNNGASFGILSTTLGPGWFGGLPHAIRLCADKVLAIMPVYLKHYSDHEDGGEDFFDNHDPYLSYMVKFDTSTESWVQVGGGDVLAFSYPNDPPPGQFDRLNTQLAWEVPSIVGGYTYDGRIFLVGCAHLYDRVFDAGGVEIEDESTYSRLAVFHGGESGGFTRTATIDLPYPMDTTRAEGMVWVGEYGCVMVVPKEASGRHVLVVFDKDGNHVASRTMPLPAPHVSQSMLAISDKTLCVSGYTTKAGKSGYYVLRSDDLGQTWEPWTTITTKADAPDEDQNSLTNYAVVSWLRQGALPASLTPGSPWRSDNRLSKPWET